MNAGQSARRSSLAAGGQLRRIGVDDTEIAGARHASLCTSLTRRGSRSGAAAGARIGWRRASQALRNGV